MSALAQSGHGGFSNRQSVRSADLSCQCNLFDVSPLQFRDSRVRRRKLADRRPVESLTAMSQQIKETVA